MVRQRGGLAVDGFYLVWGLFFFVIEFVALVLGGEDEFGWGVGSKEVGSLVLFGGSLGGLGLAVSFFWFFPGGGEFG